MEAIICDKCKHTAICKYVDSLQKINDMLLDYRCNDIVRVTQLDVTCRRFEETNKVKQQDIHQNDL